MTGNDPAGRAGAAAVNPAFLYMDALRAVLALVVAFGHIWALLIADYRPTDDLLVKSLYLAAGFGHPAVILFFVLSGFWITRSILLTPPARWTWSGWPIARNICRSSFPAARNNAWRLPARW